MSTVSNATATTGTSSTSSTSSVFGGSASQMQSEFLTLLVAQMKNQDPNNPMDNTQMVSQMAQLSQLEATTNLNTTTTSGFQMDSMLQAANKIGSQVLAPGSVVNLANGSASLGVNLAGAADSVTVGIQDASGNTIDTMNMGAQSAGFIPLSWNGQTSSGATAPNGSYTFTVNATKSGSAVSATGLSVGTLQAVSNGASGIQASVTGIGALDSSGNPTSSSVALSSIQQFL
jgi:flagellar basal-body rod modification protein FlgD